MKTGLIDEEKINIDQFIKKPPESTKRDLLSLLKIQDVSTTKTPLNYFELKPFRIIDSMLI